MDVMPNLPNVNMVVVGAELVGRAEIDAFKKHGALTKDPVRASLILTEEIGEVAKEALSLTRTPPVNGARERLVKELAQVVATATTMLLQHAQEKDLDD